MKKNDLTIKILLFLFIWTIYVPPVSSDPLIIGLNADMSSGSAQAGFAIETGIRIAIHEINTAGGLMGKQLQLLVKNHRGIPARGKANMKSFAKDSRVVAVFGGLHTPVMLAEKKALFDTRIIQIPYLTPWAAGSPVVDNPWIFRLSVRDEFAGPFLVGKAISRKFKRIALLLENTPWGRGNRKSMTKALAKQSQLPVAVVWFPWKATQATIAQKLESIYQMNAEVILLVANAPEGATIVKAMAGRPLEKRMPIISHWGITGGKFPERVGESLNDVDISFLQTFSFIARKNEVNSQRVIKLAQQLFKPNIKNVYDLLSPVGTAHAYDLTHILALAITGCNCTDRNKIKNALEHIKKYNGLVRQYDQPFKPGQGRNHDALGPEDFNLARYEFSATHQQWIIRITKN